MASTQGIQLPISLQLQNLQEIANKLKTFAGKNILADSLGGKKIDSELAKVLSTLAQIELKAKNAFKTNADFTAVERDLNKVELSLERVQGTISNLKFDDIRVPAEAQEQIEALQMRIQKLNSAFTTFKASQKDKLLANGAFNLDLSKAFKAGEIQAMLSKEYDGMYAAIKAGMDKVNAELARQKIIFQQNSNIVAGNQKGKRSFTAQGALDFISEAFKALPADASQYSEAQKMMAQFMNIGTDDKGNSYFTTFKKGAQGQNAFYKAIATQFELDEAQISEIRRRAQESAKKAGLAASEALRRVGTDAEYGAQVFGGTSSANLRAQSNEYAGQVQARDKSGEAVAETQAKADAAASAWRILTDAQREVEVEQAKLNNALKEPTNELERLKQATLSAAQSAPQLGDNFARASAEIEKLRGVVSGGREQLQKLDTALNKMQGVSNFITRYVGIYAIIRKVTQAIRSAFNNIKELDKTITGIAVVTNMSQEDLWGKIGEYTEMAQQYGVATKDVYQVSQIFYQQGLQTAQVMSLTTESLKMAKIAGIDYSTAANAMTVAIRAFKIEMADAQQVTDTYSALAAKFAVSSSEIANAMEKTASSAASVGMSLQSTSAFISVMEQTTRESAQNIGSALKSIISRYGEMKASPSKLLNVDGEDVAFNKVDTALKSIGISIKDAGGQFRDFDDVIMELAKKWDTLDNNTQRYIATIMAGNRQQSRFIALVSNYDELSRAMDTANDAENASIVQVAKTMDSLESKAQQLKNAFSQVYLDLHIENGLKDIYDWLTRIMKTIGKLGVLKGALPTLMNIVGFGTGTKKLIGMAKTGLEDKKKKYEVDTKEAEEKIRKVREEAQKDLEAKMKITADLSQLNTQKTALNTELAAARTQQETAGNNAYNAYLAAGGGASREQFEQAMSKDGGKGLLSLATGTDEQKKQAETEMSAYSEATNRVNELTNSIGQLDTAIQGLTGSTEQDKAATEGKTQAEEQGKAAVEGRTEAENQAKITIEQSKYSKGEEIASSEELANVKGLEVDAAYRVIDANTGEEIAGKQLILTKDQEGNAVYKLVNAEDGLEIATFRATNATKDKTNAERTDTSATKEHTGEVRKDSGALRNHSGSGGGGGGGGTPQKEGMSWSKNSWGEGNALKIAGVATGVARIAGTAITALGAAHQDKSTDKVETSKILTGIGNGLSMAGTGASMGMALGPWGAAIGGLAGLLIGGLGSVIDGLTMTLKEKLELQKQEVEEVKNKNLKQQAKITDLSSSIDNLNALRKVMYNSTEDMQAYKDAMNTMADQYPELISSYDEAGNAIIDINSAEEALAAARLEGARVARNAAIQEGQLHQGYDQALTEALEAVKKQKTENNGGTKMENATWKKDGMEVFSIANDTIALPSTYYYKKTSEDGRPSGKEDFDWKTSLDKISQELYQKNAEDLSEKEINVVVDYLIENPEAGAENAYTNSYYGSRDKKLTSYQWKSFKETYLNPESTKVGGISYNTEELDKVIKEYSSLFDGAESVRQLLSLEDTDEIGLPQLNQAEKIIHGVIKRNNATLDSIRSQSNYALAQESLYDTALNSSELTTKETTRLQSNSVYSQLFNQVLNTSIDKSKYKDSLDWYSQNQREFQASAAETSTYFLTWYNSLTEAERQVLESLDFTEYTSADAIISKLGISKDKDSKIYNAIVAQFVESNKTNKERIIKTIYGDEISGTLNEDLKGLAKLNYTDSTGNTTRNKAKDIAWRFAHSTKWDEEKNDWVKDDKGKIIDFGPQIISKYADYFTTQLMEINSLAEQGYTEVASKRLNILDELSRALSSIEDDGVQNDLFSTITKIDLSSFSSITSAYKAIEEYGKNNNKLKEVAPLLAYLKEAESTLVFNINTLSQELTTKVTNAAKEIDSVLSTNKAGLTLDKAIESFTKLSAAFSEIDSFDDAFKYDAVLGKYVYTADGLQKAILAKETELAEQAEQLEKTAKIYTEQLTTDGKATLRNFEYNDLIQKNLEAFTWAMNNANPEDLDYVHVDDREAFEQQFINDYHLDESAAAEVNTIMDEIIASNTPLTAREVIKRYQAMHSEGTFASSNEIMGAIKAYNISDDLLPYYQEIANQFMAISSDDEKFGAKTWDNYLAYVEEVATSNSENAAAAQAMLDEYKANKKNQLYTAIDWSKLSLGTDYSGTNKELTESLAKELGLLKKRVDEEGNAILDSAGKEIWDKVGDFTGTWEEVLDAYINKTYDNDTAKRAAKAAIKGQIDQSKSSQISTAISEVLQGNNQVLSETTLGLIESYNIDPKRTGAQITYGENGVLSAQTDFVNSALELYKLYESSLLSIKDKNDTYASILTQKVSEETSLLSALQSGSSLDISTLSSLFTTFDMQLSTYFDIATNTWLGDFENVLETDMFGKTRIKDWNAFINGLNAQNIDVSEFTKTFEYRNAFSTYVDGIITLNTQADDLIKKSLDNAFSSITAWKPINVSQISEQTNKALYDLLTKNGAATIEGGILKVNNAAEYAKNVTEYFASLSALSDQELYNATGGWTRADLAKNWKNAQTVLTEVKDTWIGISENLTGLTTDNIGTLVEKGGLDLNLLDQDVLFKKIGDKYVMTLEAYNAFLFDKIATGSQQVATPEQEEQIRLAYNKAAQAVVNKINGLDWTKILNGTATQADQDTFKTSLAEALGAIDTAIEGFYDENGNFNYQDLIADLKAQVDSDVLDEKLAKQIIDNINTTVASIRDTAFEEINSSMTMFSSGTTNQAEMTKFLQRYNELTKGSSTLDEVFQYDDLLQGYTLTSTALKKYYEEQKKVLEGLGMTDDAISEYIDNQIQQTISAEMNISEFLSSNDMSASGKGAQTLIRQIQKWYDLQSDSKQQNVKQKMLEYYGLSDIASEDVNNYVSDYFIKRLQAGGQDAVDALKELKGSKNVTSEEIQAAYKAEVNRLNTALEALDKGLAERTIVTGELATVLQKYGQSSKLTSLGDGTYVVNSVIDMVDAYLAIYKAMNDSSEATTAELNSVYAKALTAAEKKDIDAVSALGNAMGMDYETLGKLLADNATDMGIAYWTSLEYAMQHMTELGIEQIGNGKIKITDFDKFAGKIGWEAGSEEYIKALESYNDSLISDMTTTADKVVEEVKNLTEAKTGDKINLTRIQSALDMSDEAFNLIFSKYGATIKNGILTITDASKIPELTAEITKQVQDAANLIPSQIAEIKDAVSDALKSIAELIKNGIDGSLTFKDTEELKDWATKQGIDANSLNFTQTTEGLKLSEKSAIILYNKIKDIDVLQGQIVFKELNDSLKESNEHFRDITAIMERISWIESEQHPERAEQYKEELALAKEILQVRSTTEDSSFDFMSNKIPGAQNNPIKYAESWGKAWATLRDSFKTKGKDKGKIEYQDFYNIFTEMGRIAEMTGQKIKISANKFISNAEDASKLITEGAGYLSTATDGSVKVDLTKFGMSFANGAKDMQSGVDAGIKAVAQSQIDMLDSMIKLLEVVVAMEQLSDIDVDKNGFLSITEIFETDDDGIIQMQDGVEKFSKAYKDVCTQILDLATPNSDLAKALEAVKINGITMKKIFEDGKNGLNETGLSAQEYQKAVNAFYQMALSGDYNLDNLFDSIKNIMASSGLDQVSIDVGTQTFFMKGDTQFVFDWSDEEAVKAATKAIDELGTEILTKFNLSSYPDVQSKLVALASHLDDPDLTIEQKAQIQYTLSLATGEIKIEENKEKGESGYIGTYKGKHIKEKTKAEVEEAIQEAIYYEKQGFEFKFEDDGSVTGTLNIGGATINIGYDADGNTTFTTPFSDSPFTSKEDAIKDCVKNGYINADMAGYTYDGGNIEVKYDSNLNIGYTYNHKQSGEENGKPFHYKNMSFATQQQLVDYVTKVEPYTKNTEWTPSTKGNLKILTKGDAEITYNTDTCEIKYAVGQTTFSNYEDFVNYLAAEELAKGQGQEVQVKDDNSRELHYTLSGKEVTLTVTAEGTLTYEFTIGNDIYTAHNEASIKQAIADHDYLNSGTLTPSDGSTPVSYTIKKDGGTITVSYTASSVTVEGKDVEDMQTKLNAAYQEKANEVTPTATVDKVEISLSTDGKMALSEDTELKVTDAIPQVDADATELKVNPEKITADLEQAKSLGEQIAQAIQEGLNGTDLTANIGTTNTSKEDSSRTQTKNTGLSALQETLKSVNDSATTAGESFKKISEHLDKVDDKKISDVQKSTADVKTDPIKNVKDAINSIKSLPAMAAASAINSIKSTAASAAARAINGITVPSRTGNVTLKYSIKKAEAKGNVALAKGQGTALSVGTPTLMGELGPELVVSNGRYFVVGQNGAEFVNLAKDAIVFNHLQTQRLLQSGSIMSRGDPFVSEQAAVSYAKGTKGAALSTGSDDTTTTTTKTEKIDSVWIYKPTNKEEVFSPMFNWGGAAAKGRSGPAQASASAALSALKQLKAEWEAILGMSVKDLAGKAGGGGGGNKNDAFIKQLERWYNLLQQIAVLEEKITMEQTKRSKIASDLNRDGKAYYASQKDTLAYLQSEINKQNELVQGQTEYFAQRQGELNSQSAFSALYTFDNNGQIQYKSDKFAELSAMFGADATTNLPYHTIEEQYNYLKSQGYGYAMEYDSEGKKIDTKDEAGKKTAIQAFWDKIEADKSEMQSLHDSINEHSKTLIEKQTAQNEILKEIEENQIAVEGKVLKAVEDAAQREIDEMQEERSAVEKSNSNFITGLTNALNKERTMYENNQSKKDLEDKRRQLAILQRSGGSISAINSLQDEIDDVSKNVYFDKQQEQIDAIQEASDNQLKKMDEQIALATESLNYQKEHGLLWNEVSKIMAGTPESIMAYIQENDETYWGKSPADLAKSMREDLFAATKWTAYAQDSASLTQLVKKIAEQNGIDTSLVNVPQYAEGGMNYETQLVKLHGTATKPEAVLNAAQTSILKNDILGNGENSLLSLLQDLRASMMNTVSSDNLGLLGANGSIIIEHAEVNMHVDKLANGYDAAKAGDDVMREMVNIARKAGAQNRIGR